MSTWNEQYSAKVFEPPIVSAYFEDGKYAQWFIEMWKKQMKVYKVKTESKTSLKINIWCEHLYSLIESELS